MAEHTPSQAYLYSIMCLYCYCSSRIIRHLNLAVTTPPNHAQHHGLHTMCKCKRKVGRQEENWAHIKSSHHQCCEHAWRQTGWNLPLKITQQIMSSYICSHLPLPTLLLSHLMQSHPIWSLLKNLHVIAVLVTLQFALLPTPAAQMWQCFCSYGIFTVSWKAPEALGDSSTPHPRLLWVQSLCCSMRSSPRTLLGPAAIQKESNAKTQKQNKKGHQFQALRLQLSVLSNWPHQPFL